MRFQNECEKNFSSNQLTVVIVEKIPVEEELEVSTIIRIPEDQVNQETGYYRCVQVIVQFKNDVGVNSKEDQAEVEDDLDEEDMDDVKIQDERERHCSMVFKDIDGGVDDAKALLHAKGWDICVN